MNESYIILDIDGVMSTHNEFMINRKKFQEKHPEAKEIEIPYPFNKGCVKILNEILEITNSEIILSSDWKKFWSLEDINKIFKFNGVIKGVKEFTPMIKEKLWSTYYSKIRGDEINEWLEKNTPTNFVIIDDLDISPFLNTNKSNFILTIDTMGLKQTGVKEKIIKILQRQN